MALWALVENEVGERVVLGLDPTAEGTGGPGGRLIDVNRLIAEIDDGRGRLHLPGAAVVNALDVLRDLFDRVATDVHGAVEGLDEAALTHRVGGGANSIAWLVWHLTRVQDDHVADAAGTEQVWTAQGWVTRFGLPFARGGDRLRPGRRRRRGRAGARRTSCSATTTPSTSRLCSTWARLGEADLDRIVDRRWDPPVTLGVRLVSVADDDIQHAGQAAFVRGVVESSG